MNLRKLLSSLSLIICANIAYGQINTFPYTQSFEDAFTTGDNIAFINNWTGNDVNSSSSRIFQGSDARTGSSSLNIIPTLSFSGEILISLDLTGITNPKMTFYAFSKQNGSGTSTRPALLSFETSIDGGNNFLDNTQIGDDSTFPNDNTTTHTLYEYELPVAASGESSVVIRMTVTRGSGSGSSAEFVMDDVTIDEQVLPLEISSATANSSTEVVLTFNQEVTQTTAETAGNYTIDNSIAVTAASRTAVNEVTLTTSAMTNNNYTVTVNNVEDAASNTPAVNLQDSFSFVEPLGISSTTVVDKNTLEIVFNLDLDETTAETVSNYSIDSAIGNPATAVLDGTNSKKVTLTLGTDLDENNFTITVDNVQDNSTLATASGLTDTFSYLPLVINSITANSATEIEITFNQDVDATNAALAANYELNFGFGNPATAVVSGMDAAVITLTLGSEMVNNTYQLTVNDVTNTSGNATASDLTADVSYETATLSRQIVINEIYADPAGDDQPNPQVLPGGSSDEFIELYNASTKAINLEDFDLSGGTIGNFALEPGAYVILTASSNVTDFQAFGDVVAVTSWNGLTNSGEQLILKDNLGNIVDSLTYDLTWYRDDAKSDGGWTLEQINPELTCSDANNWIASNDADGGTPGAENSVFDTTPDTTGPNLIAVLANSSTELTITFNEIMDESGLTNGTFSLDNDVTVASSSPVTPGLRSTTLTLDNAMTSGTVYTLTITGVTDCSGNTIDTNELSFVFDDEAPVFQRFVVRDTSTIDLIFDEVLDEGIAETESNYSIDQSIGNPSSAVLDDTDRKRVRLEFDQALGESTDYVLTYQNLTDTLGNVINLSNETINYKNVIDTVIVRSSQLLDVFFTQEVEQASAETITNYTVDDGVGNPKTALQDDDNAKLVHLVFDQAFDDNTDLIIGFENIRDAASNFLQALNTTFVYDTDRPGIDSVTVESQNSLMVYFDEPVQLSSAEAINNYSVNNDIGIPASATRQSDRSSVLLTFSTDFVNEIENRLSISSIKDLALNPLSNTRNFTFIYDELPPSLTSFALLSPTEIELTFSENVDQTTAETVSNYSLDNGIGNPTTAQLSARDNLRVILTFNGLGNNASNTLTIANMADTNGNSTTTDLSASFATNEVAIGQITALTDTTILVQLTKALTQVSAELPGIYKLNNETLKNPDQHGTAPHLVTLTLTSAMTEDSEYTLTIAGLQDTDGNISTDLTGSFTYDSQVAGVELVNENTLEITFDFDLEETSAETVTNYELSESIGNPVSAVLDNEELMRVTLIFSTDLTEGTNYLLHISNLQDIFGDDIPASSQPVIYDETAPTIQSVTSTFTNQITVTFNESLDETNAEILNHYSLDNGIGNPALAELQDSGVDVLLTFANDLADNTDYNLTVTRVEDLFENAINSASTSFTFDAPVDPGFRDLVINEVYPNPNATSLLPNAEFVEIYNTGAEAIKLKDFTLSDNSSEASLTSYELPANGYLILTATSNASLFEGLGQVMGLANFPSLSNSGETIFLKRRDGNAIDSLAYDLSFYNDETKTNGGYSIELVNPEALCFDSGNYAASTSANQGTPGTQNAVFNNTPDTESPTVTSVTVVTAQQLRVTFSESMDVSTLAAEDFSITGGPTVFSISLENVFGTSVLLNLMEAFDAGISLTLTTSGVTDCAGNALTETDTNFFLGAIPAAEELIITEIMANPSPSQGLAEVEYLEVYNRSSSILSLAGLKLSDRSTTANLPNINIQPGAYLVLTSSANTDEFAGVDVVGVSSFPSLNTSGDSLAIADASDNLIFEVVYSDDWYQDNTKATGGFSLEMINPSPACFDDSNWIATNNTNGGTPGVQNSVFDDTPDTTAPEVRSVTVISDQQLRVSFNESMDVTSIAAGDFSFSGGLTVSDIELENEFGTSVLINLATAFTRGQTFTLTINGVNDCAGNELTETNTDFFLGATPEAEELIITEIMANPSPSQGLAEVEYLEVYNRSSSILSLAGLKLSDRSTTANLPNVNIQPGAYLVLTSSSNTNEFSGVDVAGVSSFPSLNTSGDSLAIADASDNLIFDVVYSDDWYQDDTKAAGGFSLEMINPSPACYDDSNWIATENANGGTPGVQNSVFDDTPDTTAPEVSAITVISDQHLRVSFNESMDVTSITAGDFSFNGSLTVSDIELENEFGTSVLVNLDAAFTRGQTFTLTVAGVNDCAGNALADTDSEFFLGATPKVEELIITEIMANPSPSQGLAEVEYLEVYNRSSSILSLAGLKLSDRSTTANLPNVNIQPGTYLVLTSSANTDEFSGVDVAGVSSFPSLNTSGDSLAIADASDNLIFDVVYSDDWYQDNTKAAGGFSLEMINPSPACFDDSNWIATENANGGTPGIQNSVFDDTPDSTAPEVSAVTVISDQQLRVSFNESMDVTSMAAGDFSFSVGLTVADIEFEDEFGTSVLVNLTAAFSRGQVFTLTIAGVTDCAGNALANTNSEFFLGATPTSEELIITEIMANPSPSQELAEVEYIEVYNRSSSILSLAGLKLSDRSTTANLPNVNIQPGAYLVLTSSANTDEFAGVDVAGVSSFPSLNTSGDSLAIADASDNLIFDVVYSDDWYQDNTKAAGGFSLEMINPSPACYDDSNWIATENANGGTPGIQNSVFDDTPDTEAPEVSSVTVISNQQLRVSFNESMDVTSIAAGDFSFSGGLTVSDIELENEFGTSVLVNLTAAFSRGQVFTLTIAGVTDCAGNALANTNSEFFLGATPEAEELIITEIMANPSPSQGLAEVEYLEVYNRSSSILSLNGLKLSDRSTTANLPNVNILPGAYLVLTSSANTDEFLGVDVAGVSSFSSLNTSGDSLAIADASDNLIFDVVYSDDWYQDNTKAAGGFSLEMINPSPACFDDSNWIATENANGGTPGIQNSVFDDTPDTEAPEVISAEIEAVNQFSIEFSESMDVGSIEASDFAFSNGLIVSSIDIIDEFGTNVHLTVNSNIPTGDEFSLAVSGVNDCAGNSISSTPLNFVLGASPSPGQLIITEIMADPSPSQGLPEVDYVEILNTSNQTLSLQGLLLSDRTSSTALPNASITPGAYLVLTTLQGASQLSGAIGVSGFPSLNSSGDLVAISDGSTIISSVIYSDEWYRESAKADGGFSLEIIDPNYPCLEAINWRASDSANGGTPGAVNSVADDNPDITGPKLLQAVSLNTLQLLLTYDEKLETSTITNTSFTISNGLSVSSFSIDETDRLVTITLDQELQANTAYTINSENITDCSGNLITAGFDSQEVVLALEAEEGDLLINEILFNPRSSGVRFVELYNNSTKYINLKNWTLAGASNERVISDLELISEPGTYLVLTTDADILASEYPGTIEQVVFEMSSFPSLANTEGRIAIFNGSGTQIDLFDYLEDYHSVLLDNLDGVSLERIRFAGTTNDPNNWQSASSTTGFATPGYANSQAQQNPEAPDKTVVVEPQTFAPDVAGMASFTTINYEFDNSGNVLNVRVIDANGQLIKELAKNALVGTEGFFRWDGTTESGGKARVGPYLILFEIINPDGNVSIRKEQVAIGTRF